MEAVFPFWGKSGEGVLESPGFSKCIMTSRCNRKEMELVFSMDLSCHLSRRKIFFKIKYYRGTEVESTIPKLIFCSKTKYIQMFSIS